MGFFKINNEERLDSDSETERMPKTGKEEATSTAILIQNDMSILEQLDILNKKVDVIDRNNKKFLMTASMNKNEELEKTVSSMKLGVIAILDQLDILVASLYDEAGEKTKDGIEMMMESIKNNLLNIGIEEIEVIVGDAFNPEIHKCLETVNDNSYGTDTITDLVKRGYKDTRNKLIIRPAEVVVNK